MYPDLKQVDHQLKVMLEQGRRKLQILKFLARSKEPLGSDNISKKLDMIQADVIRILNKLEEMDAVKCVTKRKRNRRFQITDKGKYHLSLIKKTVK
jgi:transcription initiation factor IIE alpha subunit